AAALFGYEQGELAGMPLTGLLPERLRPVVPPAFARYRAEGTGPWAEARRPIPTTGRTKDGREIEVELTFSPLRRAELPADWMLTVVRDVSERNQRQREFESILNAVSHGVHGIGRDGMLRFSNDVGAAMFGYTQDELRSRPLHE